MPLIRGGGEKAFKHNVKTEYEEGKPLKQSLAIAYAMKKKKKMAQGGDTTMTGGHIIEREKPTLTDKLLGMKGNVKAMEWEEQPDKPNEPMKMAHGGRTNSPNWKAKGWTHEKDYSRGVHKDIGHKGESYAGEIAKKGHTDQSKHHHKSNLETLKSMPNPKIKGLADGGYIEDNYQSSCTEHCTHPDHIHEEASGFVSHPGNDVKHNKMATQEDDRLLNQHGEDEVGPGGYAHGGFIGSHQTPEHEMDMVGRIMKQRQHQYSQGGRVANDVHQFRSDFETDNNFDDLVERDNLEFNYTGANSGDEIGNKQEDHDRSDIVARIMSSRRKKDKYPTAYWSEIANDPRLKRS